MTNAAIALEPVIWVAIIGVLAGVLTTFITALAGVVVSLLNRKKVDNLHTLINSNLARQIESAIGEALSRGIIIGVEQERQRNELIEKPIPHER